MPRPDDILHATHTQRDMSAPEAVFRAVVDRIIPADQDPGALLLGTAEHARGVLDARPDLATEIAHGLSRMDEECLKQHGKGFAVLAETDKDAALLAHEHLTWFAQLVEIVSLGVYADPANGGNRNAESWRWLGYRHRLPDGPNGPPRMAARQGDAPSCPGDEYDVVVVGAGAGGGVAACALAEAGLTVLVVERGRRLGYEDAGHRDHLRNHRLSAYGNNTGPGCDEPRVFIDPAGNGRTVAPHEFEYHNNAVAVGGGTFVYGAQAWRFHPDDFRMASRYGVPEGSSLVDWPISYEDLAPYYERAEWEIGVAGEASASYGHKAPGRGFPMPPVPAYEAARLLKRGATRLGMDTFTPPLAVNTTPYGGRAACIECGSCVGFPCPVQARGGIHNTVIPKALATGRCELALEVHVERIDTDSTGRASGVICTFGDQSGKVRRKVVRARAVVVAAGAIETARLLLLSGSPHFPEGIGNRHGLVGRNLQGHLYPTAYGLFDQPVHNSRGPGVSIATTVFVHGNPGVIGGAMLADDFLMTPAAFFASALPPAERRWGRGAKQFVRHAYSRVLQVKGPVHEIPDPTCRIELDPSVKDRWGLPVARLSGAVHSETMRTAMFIRDRAGDWVRASGAARTWTSVPPRRLSGYQHQAGTCRMGTDPAASVTDPFGRVWYHDNIFICDGSLHPTNGSYNPVLTIMALAYRNAEHVAMQLG